ASRSADGSPDGSSGSGATGPDVMRSSPTSVSSAAPGRTAPLSAWAAGDGGCARRNQPAGSATPGQELSSAADPVTSGSAGRRAPAGAAAKPSSGAEPGAGGSD